MNKAKANNRGKNTIQHILISLSYLTLGKVALTQI